MDFKFTPECFPFLSNTLDKDYASKVGNARLEELNKTWKEECDSIAKENNALARKIDELRRAIEEIKKEA